MMNEKKYIAFDLGAESGRCMVAILNNNKVSYKEVHRFITHKLYSDCSLFWNLSAIEEEIIMGLRKASVLFGSSFSGIGIDTWGVDYVLIDANGNTLNQPYHYRDKRTKNIIHEVFEKYDREKLYNITGNSFAEYNTLFQLIAEKSNPSNNLDKAHKLLLMPDYLKYFLTGKIQAEFTIASTTNLTDARNRNWSPEVIDAFELPLRLFPGIIEPGGILGGLISSVAETTGINIGIPIYSTAGHDTASAVISIPGSADDGVFISSGTWSIIGKVLKQPLIDKNA
ncbi:MAG: hypothetical protein JW995_15195, partial [Melioribacteraceae bacterium]|nr:hypothetical protein [Melioribacteraceae bacterium]